METKPNDALKGAGFASAADALAWLIAMGVDEIALEQPVDRFAESAKRVVAAPPVIQPAAMAEPTVQVAPAADASGFNSIAEIMQALNFFETHPLRKNAMKLSFFEGHERADILIVGDHPRKEEDRSGLVFAEKSRLLLANMLAAINLKLEDVALMNLMPWRPLGGAAPKPAEVVPVLPFVRRAVELVQPRLILAFSALPGHHLAGGDASIQRQRGKWLDVGGVPLLSTFHPDELLRMPNLKRQAWRDLLTFKERIS